MTREFSLSKHRIVLYSLAVFFASAFFSMWFCVLLVGRVWRITGYEFASVFCIAVGVTVLFIVFFSSKMQGGKVRVGEEGIEYMRGARSQFIRFADIFCVRSHIGPLHRMLGTVKVIIESKSGQTGFYLGKADARSLVMLMPAFSDSLRKGGHMRVTAEKGRFTVFLSDFFNITVVFVALMATALPSIALFLFDARDVGMFTLSCTGIYLGIVLVDFAYRGLRFFRYAGYAAILDEEGIRVSFGSTVRARYRVLYKKILCFEICQTFIEKLFGLCRIKMRTEQNVDGISDAECFPFAMNKARAQEIVRILCPDFDVNEKPAGGGMHAFAPYLQYLLIPAVIIFVMSFFLNFLLLFLLLDIALFGFLLYIRKGHTFKEHYADVRCGVFSERRAIIPYTRMRVVIGKSNAIAYRLKNTLVEICIGKTGLAYFPGYIPKEEFSVLVEKADKKG